MSITDLEKALAKVVNDFTNEAKGEFERYDTTPATKQDMYVLAQITSAALDDFKKSIVNYLKSNQ